MSGGNTLIAQGLPAIPAPQPTSSTILPTDVLPLPSIQNRMTFGENLQLRILQKLPAKFYFNSSTETSFRLETNPFQFPTKRIFERQLLPLGTPPLNRFPLASQQNILNLLRRSSSRDMVYRVLPNVTAGFAITPRTRVYVNYFMIRDSLFRNVKLNSVTQSISWGAQHDFPLGTRANLQADIQARELFQTSSFYGTHNLQGGTSNVHPLFDFLPGLTLSYVATPRTVLFANALVQMRSREYFTAPRAEIDPFYTWGMLHQRGRWSFSASSTLVQNFRGPFHRVVFSRTNNYSMISDFEIARRIVAQLPGLQAFIRAEPIWNMHSHNKPGLAGMDFRLFWGLRFAMTKPALTSALDSLRRQLEEQEVAPPAPSQPAKPSAYLKPEEVTATRPQPIHGMLPEVMPSVAEAVQPPSFGPAQFAQASAADTDSLLSLHPEMDMPLIVAQPSIAAVADGSNDDDSAVVQAIASTTTRPNKSAKDIRMFIQPEAADPELTGDFGMYVHNAVGKVN